MPYNNSPITIVSGLPRSGTSMMMQLLKHGGCELLTDNIRQNDENNPKGYYEYEKVKQLPTNSDWLNEAEDKVVKIISHFITFLPNNHHYKIIFMQRPIAEVLLSQQKMLGKDIDTMPYGMEALFTKQLEQSKKYIINQSNMELLCVNYNDVIFNPEAELLKINDFLGKQLSINEMLKGVDVSLYRNKMS